MNRNYKIDFHYSHGGPFYHAIGEQAKWLVKHSKLIQMLLENEPKADPLIVEVDMPSDRIVTFRKILQGVPVGYKSLYYGWPNYIYYQLGKQEEKNIRRQFKLILNNIPEKYNASNENDESEKLYFFISKERKKVIDDILNFLILDEEGKQTILKYDDKDETVVQPRMNINELERRKNINTTRKNYRFLNEDAIDDLIERHKNYLYSEYIVHGQGNNDRLLGLMNANNIKERNAIQQNYKENLKRRTELLNKNRQNLNDRRKRLQKEYDALRKNGRYSKRNREGILDKFLHNMDKLDDEYNALMSSEREIYENTGPYPYNYSLNHYFNKRLLRGLPKHPKKATSKNYERHIRSKRREGIEKYIPNEKGELTGLFGNNNEL